MPPHPGPMEPTSPPPGDDPQALRPVDGPELWDQLWRNLREAVERCRHSRWENTRPLHQLRVALRRVSVATRVWQAHLAPETFASLDVPLRRLRRWCGPARDLDVRRASLERWLSDCDPRHLAVVDLLYERATLQRETLQPGLLRQLDRFSRRIPNPIPPLHTTPQLVTPSQSQAAPLAALRAQILEAFEKLPTSTVKLDCDLHDLRLDLKQLRYRLELLADCDPQAGLEDGLRLLRQLQNSLGDFHDAEVAREELQALRDRWNRHRHRRHWSDRPEGLFTWRELRSGLKYLRRLYRQQRDSALAEFHAQWSEALSPEGLPRLRTTLTTEPQILAAAPPEESSSPPLAVPAATSR